MRNSAVFEDANSLALAGLIPFSATDWPGKLTATVFTQGCPLRCVYCHNAQLQDFPVIAGSEPASGVEGATRGVGSATAEGRPLFSDALELMERRRGMLDGLVISGGEPLAAAGLPAAIADTKAAGFPVGLHTSGYAPARLRALLSKEATRPDWIGLDVKALPRHAAAVTGLAPRAAERMWDSLRVAAAAAEQYGVELQMRTTLWPGSVIEQHLEELQGEVAKLGHELHLQWARNVDGAGRYVA
ncbi:MULTISPECIES: radical SAM protein [Corynebacterium]|uniref:radical SAM protein n=1 Tax=Corynebacterium TaxID=1716 RepID=UPI0002B3F77F|nr:MULTISPECIES: radical SAM protein [Corynebacterium]AGE35893.1 radical SAM domain protein [Corynebacterium urealyticum DSM 7111]MDK6301832.1 radical SAM protein [Corynebacterium sp. UMB9976]QQB07601.1 radical SAM protein [Corynebacterium urealyticum]